MEVSGLEASASLEGSNAQAQAGATTTDYYSSGNITTANTSFVIGCSQNIAEATPGTGTITAGATPAYTLRENGGTGIIVTETLASQAAGTFDANFTRNTAHRCITAVMAFKEAAAGGPTYTQSVGGALSFAGGLGRITNKPLSASLSFTGALIKQPSKLLSGGLTFAGNNVKHVNKPVAGTLSFSGTTVKRTDKLAAGTLSFSGAMSAIRTLLQAVSGALSFSSGTVSKSTTKSTSGSLSFSGGTTKATQKLMLGTLSFSGQALKTTSKNVVGVLTFAGTAVANLVGAVTLGVMTALLKVLPALRADAKADPAVAGKAVARDALNGGPKTK